MKVTFYKLKMLLGDKLFFAAMIIVPLLITIAAGYALRNEKLNVVPVAFVDDDASVYSKRIIAGMSQKEGFLVLVSGHGEAPGLLENGKVEQVFIIKQGFEQRILHGDTTELIDVISSPSSYSSGFTSEVVAGEVTRLITGSLAADWVEKQYSELGKPAGVGFRENVEKYTQALWKPKPLMTIDYREMHGDRIDESKSTAIPAASVSSLGLIAAFIMFYMLFGSGWLVEERANGTIKRLATAPGALRLSFGGNALALLAAGLIQLLLFYAADKLLFGVELFKGGLSYVVFGVYIMAVISISLFMSSIFKTQAQLQAAAPVLALLTGFAGGCFWNFVEVPQRIKLLSRFTPQGWALEAVNALRVNPADPSAILLPVIVLGCISLILLPLSYFLIIKSVEN